MSQLGLAAAARQHGDVIDIGILDHRLERLIGIAGRKFMPDVFLPKMLQL